MKLSNKDWQVIAITITAVCSSLFAVFFGVAYLTNKDMADMYVKLDEINKELNDNYIAEQKIVDQMEQVIADKNMEIDELNAQIKQLKEVK